MKRIESISVIFCENDKNMETFRDITIKINELVNAVNEVIEHKKPTMELESLCYNCKYIFSFGQNYCANCGRKRMVIDYEILKKEMENFNPCEK